jgi:hypothetical protein
MVNDPQPTIQMWHGLVEGLSGVFILNGDLL